MKKIILFLILFLAVVVVQAQRDKEFQIRGGFGFAVYGTTSEFTFTGFDPDVVLKDEDGAATVHLPLEFRYEFSRRFNAGLDIKFGSYLYDPDSSEGKSNRFFAIGLAVEYNFISNDNFRWYAGLGVNSSVLNLEEDYTLFGNYIHQEAFYDGPGVRINTGIMWFFAGPLGLNANVGFDSHNFKLDELHQNGQQIDLDDTEATLSVKGVDITLGLALRF